MLRLASLHEKSGERSEVNRWLQRASEAGSVEAKFNMAHLQARHVEEKSCGRRGQWTSRGAAKSLRGVLPPAATGGTAAGTRSGTLPGPSSQTNSWRSLLSSECHAGVISELPHRNVRKTPGSSRRNESIIIVFFWSEREKALFWQTTGSCLGLPRCCCCDDRFEFVVVGELESEVRRSCLEAFCPNRRDSAPHDGN